MTDDTRKELTHIIDLQDFYFSKWDPERLRQADDAFHDAICYMSKRTVIKDTLIPLHRKTRRYRRIAMSDKARATVTLKEHHAIYDAMMAGDADLARKLTAEHIQNAKIHMLGEEYIHG